MKDKDFLARLGEDDRRIERAIHEIELIIDNIADKAIERKANKTVSTLRGAISTVSRTYANQIHDLKARIFELENPDVVENGRIIESLERDEQREHEARTYVEPEPRPLY